MLTPKEFAQRAGFPKKWQERHLQDYVIAQLKERGYSAQDEVPMLGGQFRADIVTNWASPKTIIEMKNVVSSDDIYKATRQLQIYAKHLQGERKIIMGLFPAHESAQKSVLKNAEQSQADGIETVFLNCEPQWFPEDSRRFKKLRQLVSVLRLAWDYALQFTWKDFKLQAQKNLRRRVLKHKKWLIAIAVVFGLFYGFLGAQLLHQLAMALLLL